MIAKKIINTLFFIVLLSFYIKFILILSNKESTSLSIIDKFYILYIVVITFFLVLYTLYNIVKFIIDYNDGDYDDWIEKNIEIKIKKLLNMK